MPNRISDASSNRDENGFVLITVIWGLGLLSVLVMAFVLNVHTQTKITSNLIIRAQTEALADAGVNIAILDLVNNPGLRTAPRRFPHNATPVSCRIGKDTVLKISVQDEEGKVDLNTANFSLLKSLLSALTNSESLADTYADAIIDFRDHDDLRRAHGAELKEYQAAGRKRGPKNYPFQTNLELYQVLNLPSPLVRKLTRITTIHSKRGGFDLNVMPPDLRIIFSGNDKLTSLYRISSSRRTFLVRSEASGPNGGLFIREAIVRITPNRASGFQILEWQIGEADENADTLKPADITGQPDC